MTHGGTFSKRKSENWMIMSSIYRSMLWLSWQVILTHVMDEQTTWFDGKPAFENMGLSLQSDTEAYSGHLRKARDLTQRAVDSAVRADNKESAAIWQGHAAIREAAFGNAKEARQAADQSLKLAPLSQATQVEAAMASAIAGDTARAKSLAQDLAKRLPVDTQMQSIWLPTIRAQLMLPRNPSDAIDLLKKAAPFELGQIQFNLNISCLYPVYMKGEAYLATGDGSAATTEFQKILDHSGIVCNCCTGSLARLGLARAYATLGDTAKARSAYQDFLKLWKDADPDIPILKEARAEYAKIQ